MTTLRRHTSVASPSRFSPHLRLLFWMTIARCVSSPAAPVFFMLVGIACTSRPRTENRRVGNRLLLLLTLSGVVATLLSYFAGTSVARYEVMLSR